MREILVLFLILILPRLALTQTVTFSAGFAKDFDIEFVEIGSPGNEPDFDERFFGDEKFFGAVDYVYSISKFEASCEGYNLFADIIEVLCLESDENPVIISRAGILEYVNWLNQIQGYPAAYDFTIGPLGNVNLGFERNPEARFFLPTADEWHKAAYYDPVTEVYYEYATGSDEPPTNGSGDQPGTVVVGSGPLVSVQLAGGESPFGAVGQTGNAHEIEENYLYYGHGRGRIFLESHLVRRPVIELSGAVGFRLVAVPPVPEPSGQFLALIALFGFVGAFRKSRP